MVDPGRLRRRQRVLCLRFRPLGAGSSRDALSVLGLLGRRDCMGVVPRSPALSFLLSGFACWGER